MTSIAPESITSTRFSSSENIHAMYSRNTWCQAFKRHLHRVTSYLLGAVEPYPVAKFRDYDQYRESVSYWRVAAVLILTPMSALISSVVPSFIPLQNPLLGLFRNVGFIGHFVVLTLFSMLGAALQVRGVTRIPHDVFRIVDVFIISVVATILYTGITLLMAYYWRFPVPFMWVFAFGPWSFSFSLTTALVLRRRSLSREYRGRLLRFIPSFVMQLSQILIYPACSAAFEVMNDWQRVIFVLCLPLLRRAVKRMARATVRRYSSDFEQLADVACAVEIASSIYQVMIMQATPTVISTSAIIGFDLIQGLISIGHFFEKRSVVAQHTIISSAAEILARQDWATDSTATHSKQPAHDLFNISRAISKSSSKVLGIKRSSWSNTQLSRDDEKIVVRHALEVLNAAEIILVVEYLEVVIPTVCYCFILIAAHFDSARFNPRISQFYFHNDQLVSVLRSLGMYITLQMLSVVVMHWVMSHRYGLSASTFLAYVLECHAGSIQGKMVGWLTVLMYFSMLHYGTDFTFKFKFMPIDDP